MNDRINPGYIAAILAGLSFGSIPIIAALLRDVNVSVTEQTFLRLFLGAIISLFVLVTYRITKYDEFKISLARNIQKTYFWQGLIFVLAILAYVGSIVLETPVGEASFLVQIHPVLTLIFGVLILKEEINRRKVTSLVLAFCGLIILTRPWDWTSFLSSFAGDLLALSNGIIYAIYLLIGAATAKARQKVSFYISVSWVLCWGLIWGLPILTLLMLLPLPSNIIAFNIEILFTPNILFLGILLAFLGSILPYALIMISNTFDIESSKQSILMLGEPISAALFAFLILSEEITIWYILGGFVLSLAIVNLVRASQQTEKSAKNLS
ncbi:MAG: DMT family transporter [Candidatus Heimdallarchaeota archaeon]|nr:DMT family transporter [Candidatus Heimdallarchaeota archaeon]